MQTFLSSLFRALPTLDAILLPLLRLAYPVTSSPCSPQTNNGKPHFLLVSLARLEWDAVLAMYTSQ